MKNNGNLDLTFGGSGISMSEVNVSELEREAARKSFNEATDKASKAFQESIDRELEAAKKIKEETVNLEIYPTDGNALARLYDTKPWE